MSPEQLQVALELGPREAAQRDDEDADSVKVHGGGWRGGVGERGSGGGVVRGARQSQAECCICKQRRCPGGMLTALGLANRNGLKQKA